MFLCRVVVGEYCMGQNEGLAPDVRHGHQLYDTTVNDTKNPSIFVTYHDAQVLYACMYVQTRTRTRTTTRRYCVYVHTHTTTRRYCLSKAPRALGFNTGVLRHCRPCTHAHAHTTHTKQAYPEYLVKFKQ